MQIYLLLLSIAAIAGCAVEPSIDGDDQVVKRTETITERPEPAPAPKPMPVPPLVMPEFTWPPPKASAVESIPDKWLVQGGRTTLADVASIFEKALRIANHTQWSYYSVPHGFALATHLEQIHTDGTPLEGADRWTVGTPTMRNLTLADFIRALAAAPVGEYRAIVFIVTDAPWSQSSAVATSTEIERWATSGLNALPSTIGKMSYGASYRTKALVYQFRKKTSGSAEQLSPSSVSGKTHLRKSGLWGPLSIL